MSIIKFLSENWQLLPFIFGVMLLILSETIPVIERFLHSWSKKILILILLTTPVIIHTLGQYDGVKNLEHQMVEFIQFMIYSASLFIIGLSIVLKSGNLRSTPAVNTLVIIVGGLSANFIGSGAAGIITATLLLASNAGREHTWHSFAFTIYIVANTAAMLTPQADAPNFILMLYGMEYFWLLRNVVDIWLFTNFELIVIYILIETFQYSREKGVNIMLDEQHYQKPKFEGVAGAIFLFFVIIHAMVYFNTERTTALIGITWGIKESVMLLATLVSLFLFSPVKKDSKGNLVRHQKPFSFDPILNVAWVFALLFFTIIPIKEMIGEIVNEMNLTSPGANYLVYGFLSTVMDNAISLILGAPNLPITTSPDGVMILGELRDPEALRGLAAGTVQGGAFLTFSNWPNLIIYIMAKRAGVKMPSPLLFMMISIAVLTPVYWSTWWFFFS